MNASEITKALQSGKNHMVEIRGAGGKKLLTLSYRQLHGFRFFRGSKPRGGGQKHTPCTVEEAEKHVLSALHCDGTARLH